jgi:hypothetical protein
MMLEHKTLVLFFCAVPQAFYCCYKKVYKLQLIVYSNLVTVKIELSQSLHDISLSIATRLGQENVLKEQTIEELMLATLRILIKEYEENPQSVITYFLKRNSRDSKDMKE